MKTVLSDLKPGSSGTVLSVDSENKAVRRRLLNMGVTPGVTVTVKKSAPLGDPIEIGVRGYDLSLRKSDAALITIGDRPPEKSKRESHAVRYGTRRPDKETARRMRLAHEHESAYHQKVYDGSAHDRREMKLALAGNPNSGKTTLFNALTGSEQYVGNWPGVTVEKKEGKAHVEGRSVTIVDLPGIYSLSPYSQEEIVSRDFIIGEKPDAIINIVDATNLERNLYLTVSLLELERPMVVALNFMDEARARGDVLDVKLLSRKLGVPVVPITARTGENLDELLKTAHGQMHTGFNVEPDDLYDSFTHEIHHVVGELIHDYAFAKELPAHWCAVRLVEGDELVLKALSLPDDVAAKVEEAARLYESSSTLGDRETLVSDARYGFIEDVAKSAIRHGTAPGGQTRSDKIDRVLTGKYLAIPVFLLTMLLIFAITFGPPGAFLSDGMGLIMDEYIGVWIATALTAAGSAPWLVSLCADGIVSGVGGVLSFLPQIALLFFFLTLLEDSGYMARAAFITDRLLRRFGLSGKAFIPMLMGFGCTVPAVMGARTMENEKDRRMTIMLLPFMSCSAKLPVFGLIASAFFGRRAALVVFSLYILGMLMAVLSGVILKRSAFRGADAPFLLELPPYRFPVISNTMRHVWEKIRGFLVRAGSVILVVSVILWVLQNFSPGFTMTEDSSKSILAVLGTAIAPVFTPLGFGSWQASVALLTGFIAKEAVVASLSMFCGFGLGAPDAAVSTALGAVFISPAAAFAYLVFILLYVPCVAAVSAIYKEMGSLRWTFASVGWQLGTAYVTAFAAFHIASLLF